MILDKEILLPHAIEKPTDTAYRARMTRAKQRVEVANNTAVFQVQYPLENGETRLENCVVGQEVLYKGTPRRVTGAEKYVKGQFDVYMLAMLQQLIPEGHNNIVLSIAHPPDAINQIDRLMSVVGGKHTIITPDGKTVEYVISAAVPVDECSGGLIRAMTGDFADYNQHDLNPGDKIAIIDIGGKVSSFTPAILHENNQVQILFDEGRTFEKGIQDVEQSLDEELRAMYPDLFKRSVPARIIDQAIRDNGIAYVHNERMDFTDAVNLAIAPLLNDIERIYIEDMKRLLDARFIFATGGGSGKTKIQLDEIFDIQCALADSAHFIQLANRRGMEYIFRQWIERSRKTTLAKVFARKTPPVFACFDLGNTFGKGLIFCA